ncbi:MAG: hypothetical protein KKH94_02050 [Candidatus Omnitrophica bacterium]|nr:hypothetical protein [Candidatus Omnitrophota bacterium]
MEEHTNNQKRTLRDVSHVFLSSLEEQEGEASINSSSTLSNESSTIHRALNQKDIPQQNTYRFLPSLKTVSIFPIVYPTASLLFHIELARTLVHAPYKIYVVSANPHQDSWRHLENNFDVPAYVDIDFSKRIHTFKLYENVELLVIAKEIFPDFFTFKTVTSMAPQVFDTEGKTALFLLDFFNVDFYLQEKISSLVDSVLLLTSLRVEDLRMAYKLIKTSQIFCPHTTFNIIGDEKLDSARTEFLMKELNAITSRFLNLTVHHIGSCACKTLLHDSGARWNKQDSARYLDIDTNFLATIKKDTWSEELLSLYQTVIGLVK